MYHTASLADAGYKHGRGSADAPDRALPARGEILTRPFRPCYLTKSLKPNLQEILHRAYRELRPRAPIPHFRAEFYPFANVNNTIRLREGVLHIRFSDLLEGAPENVIEAIAHILLAKIYKKPIESLHATRYRRYVGSHDLSAKAHLVRQMRGRKRIESAQGKRLRPGT